MTLSWLKQCKLESFLKQLFFFPFFFFSPQHWNLCRFRCRFCACPGNCVTVGWAEFLPITSPLFQSSWSHLFFSFERCTCQTMGQVEVLILLFYCYFCIYLFIFFVEKHFHAEQLGWDSSHQCLYSSSADTCSCQPWLPVGWLWRQPREISSNVCNVDESTILLYI